LKNIEQVVSGTARKSAPENVQSRHCCGTLNGLNLDHFQDKCRLTGSPLSDSKRYPPAVVLYPEVAN